MDRAVCLATVVEDAGQGRRAAVVAALILATGLAACSSPMPPWQPPRTTIQPAPSPMSAPVSQPPLARPAPVVPAMPPAGTATEPPRSNVGMANPASEYCLQRGGQLEFSTRANGAEVGTCVSPGGDECEEWAFLRGSCTW
ncbi:MULTISPECIES: DUF333 domain-containing protein [Ralstonia]|jgi:putative hemolysin|uniref:DUF333 domain-containing protein n=1 Tax=Ralstonia flaminis TaxID=3058597 RepID=A0ABN9JPE2_9RALS|nr:MULTISPECIES: DUF333 domain-containing protein [unclassified Ralstonia]CAJ0819624.1 hypothetical protein LMG18101_04011 [Ralstonia sp. LMG 18101]